MNFPLTDKTDNISFLSTLLIMSLRRTLLIVGATGKQGSALIESLLALPESANYTILALTRKATSPSASSLARKSTKIKLVEGNLDDCPAIFTAASRASSDPIWGVFGLTNPNPFNSREVVHGKALIDAALASGVRQFVFSSVERGGEKSSVTPTNVPHFITKHDIEEHLRSQAAQDGGKMAWTILRPVAFMENFTPNLIGRMFATSWKQYIGPDKPFQLISCPDIGLIAAQAFIKPEEYRNRSLSIATDELSYTQAEHIFHDKVGADIPTTYGFVVNAAMWAIKDMDLMFRFFGEEAFGADVKALRKQYPGLLTFGDWLEQKSAFVKR